MQCQIADPLPNVSPVNTEVCCQGNTRGRSVQGARLSLAVTHTKVLVLLKVCVSLIVVQQLRKLIVCLLTQLCKCRNLILQGVQRIQIAMCLHLH
jgi:hypothetical protein